MRQTRIAARMGRDELASRVHEPAWKIDQIEADTKPIDDSLALRLGVALSEDAEWLLDGDDPASPEAETFLTWPSGGVPLLGLSDGWLRPLGVDGHNLRVLVVDAPGAYPQGSILLWEPTPTPDGAWIVAGPSPHLAQAGSPHPLGAVVAALTAERPPCRTTTKFPSPKD